MITGNFIGTDVTGKAALPNGGNGVTIAAGTSGTIIRRGDVGSPESQRHLRQLRRWSLDHVVIGQRGRIQLHRRRSEQPKCGIPNRGNGVSIHAAAGNGVFEDVIQNNAAYGILTDNGSNNNSWAYNSIELNSFGGIFESNNPSLQAMPVLTGVTFAHQRPADDHRDNQRLAESGIRPPP